MFTLEMIDALSETERGVLGLIYINQDQGHAPSVIRTLVKRNWITEVGGTIPGNPGGSPIDRLPLRVKRYEASCIQAHMVWCEWCSLHCPPEEDA